MEEDELHYRLAQEEPLCTYLVAGAAHDRLQLRMHVVAFAKGK